MLSIESLARQITFAPRPHHHDRYAADGKPLRKTLHRVTSGANKDWIKQHTNVLVKVRTDNEEVIGYLIRHDLAGVRVAHFTGFVKDNFYLPQPRRENWVVDDVKQMDIRALTYLN